MSRFWLIFLLILVGASNARNAFWNNGETWELETFYRDYWRQKATDLWWRKKEHSRMVYCKTLGIPADNTWLEYTEAPTGGYSGVSFRRKEISKDPSKPKNPMGLRLRCLGDENGITECPVLDVKKTTSSDMNQTYKHCDDLRLMLRDGSVQRFPGYGQYMLCPGKFVDDRRFARVVCRTMAFNGSHVINTYLVLPTEHTIFMGLNCSDDDPASRCSIHTDDFNLFCSSKLKGYAGVFCTDQAPQYRLTNIDKLTGIGRLEVTVSSRWGAVCSDNAADAFATVACRSLGLPSTNAQSFPYLYMGNGKGGLYQTQCSGNESSLNECVSGWRNDCEHNAFLGLSCSNAQQGELRLNTLKDGRLEVYSEKQWLGISLKDSTSAGIYEATVICRSLNMSTIAVSGTLSNTTENCWLAVEECSGNESSIMNCGNTTFAKSPFRCHPLTVVCGDGEKDIRIADDSMFEVRRLGVWGSVNVLKYDLTAFSA